MKVKCVITRYDDKIKKPPFKTIKVDETTIKENKDGNERLNRLKGACTALGYTLKFYTLADENTGYKYEIVVV